jgi:hypothetical protein
MRPLSEEDDAAIAQVEQLLAGCILPAKDVLLPTVCRSDHGTTFLVVASPHEKGVELVVHRICDQLAGCEVLAEAGLEAAVSHVAVALPGNAEVQPLTRLVEDVVHKIERLIAQHA